MAAIEATRPAFWVQLAASTQLSVFLIQPLNGLNPICVYLRTSAAKVFSVPRLHNEKAGRP
ncbi:MAG: hypothetical protein LAO78_05410 [Acidobacteriia bacterium]|nr:hypothetical protein [Terriglobia bacterium]